MRRPVRFSIEEYLSLQRQSESGAERYEALLGHVKACLDAEWETAGELMKGQRLALEKGAIIGYERDAGELKEKIRRILTEDNLLSESYPAWYPSLADAVFSDLYGLSGIAPWAYEWKDEYKDSSSAKLIGDRLWCLIDGKSVLQPQRIPEERRGQLLHALLLSSPAERREAGFHEVYLHNGIRVTIYSGDRCRPGQDITVFRKYVLKKPSLELLAEKNTFPKEAVPLFKAMCRIGYNVVFAGQIRSGKTTFLQAWQAEEDPSLEGVAVATDPETRWDEILPKAPIMQLTADSERLLQLEKSLKRSDADYVILEEMRDAISYELFLAITNLGTMRSKGTIHDNSAINIPYKMASAIAARTGENENALIAQLFTNINYVFELCQLPEDRSQKRLTAITELCYDAQSDTVFAVPLCKRDPVSGIFSWNPNVSSAKQAIAAGNSGALDDMKKALKALAKEHELKNTEPVYPAYYAGNLKRERSGI